MTLCLALLGCISMSAQDKTFEFCDKNGNVIADGSTVTFTEAEEDPDFGMVTMHADLFIKNTTDNASYAAIRCVGELPDGDFKICFPQNCIQKSSFTDPTFDFTTEGGGHLNGSAIAKSDAPVSLETAWMPTTYGSFSVTYQILLCEPKTTNGITTYDPVAEGSKITANFIYSDPTGINGVKDTGIKKEVARYNIGGQLVGNAVKGLNIIKYSDGTTVKTVK